jgi:hypothetical protein
MPINGLPPAYSPYPAVLVVEDPLLIKDIPAAC